MNRTKSGLTAEDRDVLRGLFEIARAELVERLAADDPSPEKTRREITTLDGLLAALDDDRLAPTDEVRRLIVEIGGSVDGLLGRVEDRRPAPLVRRAA